MEDYGAATLRPNTLRSYEQFIRCYIKPYLGDKIVSRVTRMDIQKLYRKLKHEGRVREHPEHGARAVGHHGAPHPTPCSTGA